MLILHALFHSYTNSMKIISRSHFHTVIKLYLLQGFSDRLGCFCLFQFYTRTINWTLDSNQIIPSGGSDSHTKLIHLIYFLLDQDTAPSQCLTMATVDLSCSRDFQLHCTWQTDSYLSYWSGIIYTLASYVHFIMLHSSYAFQR